uniref:Uncharacterized protein n=1 Tax=Caulobacter sp. (strain K31) TaxID=366602 RepID=B0T0L4_CAUSK
MMDDTKGATDAGEFGATPPAATVTPAQARHERAKVRRRVQGTMRRWLWAVLAFLMLVVGGVAACQAPGWLGPSHHEPGLARPAEGGRP